MKVRSEYVGTAKQVTRVLINGVQVSSIAGLAVNVSTREQLEVTSGHPFNKLGKPKRKPKPPRPYKGKKPEKISAYWKAYDRYVARYVRYQQDRSADIGGPFQVRKATPVPALHFIVDQKNLGGGAVQIAQGRYSTNINVLSSAISIVPSSGAQLDAYGTIGISKTLPTNPLVNMGQFLIELRDLPRFFNPAGWKEKADYFRNYAHHKPYSFRSVAQGGSGEYLNVAFGWLPLLSDIVDFTNVSLHYQKHINQYARDSGRHVRRSKKIIDSESTVSTVLGTGLGPYPTPTNIVSGGTLTRDVTTRQRVWFKGSYTYYLPPIDGSAASYYARYSAYAQKLYGLNLSPDLLWKVSPWTWAIDWMTNTGHVIRNWDAFHNKGLVLHYGYVMETKSVLTKYSLSGFRLASNPLSSLTDFRLETSKVRRKATPYGFGLNPASFTPFQNGVIAALGINQVAKWL